MFLKKCVKVNVPRALEKKMLKVCLEFKSKKKNDEKKNYNFYFFWCSSKLGLKFYYAVKLNCADKFCCVF